MCVCLIGVFSASLRSSIFLRTCHLQPPERSCEHLLCVEPSGRQNWCRICSKNRETTLAMITTDIFTSSQVKKDELSIHGRRMHTLTTNAKPTKFLAHVIGFALVAFHGQSVVRGSACETGRRAERPRYPPKWSDPRTVYYTLPETWYQYRQQHQPAFILAPCKRSPMPVTGIRTLIRPIAVPLRRFLRAHRLWQHTTSSSRSRSCNHSLPLPVVGSAFRLA
ncbi:unnamed protein product [Mycena citricolor]|uniref:Uncharacterized protein n=1 Tax=Mycena citricolor TaxID=2018698 RepID=A0AAD2JV23_9AGAR|nr:unnamed protein product [Mycena citricolor]